MMRRAALRPLGSYRRSFHTFQYLFDSQSSSSSSSSSSPSSSSSLQHSDTNRKVKGIKESLHEFTPEDVEGSRSTLPFDLLKNSETYGMLVRSEHEGRLRDPMPPKVKVIDRQDFIEGNYFAESTRADELKARYLPETLAGKFSRHQVQLPEAVAQAINNHIVKAHETPNTLRTTAARMFVAMGEDGLHRAPKTGFEVDAHVATVFLQNYAAAHQVLLELKRTVEQGGGSFSPRKVLDVGYGPATGMVALNELMGEEFSPKVKHALIAGDIKGVPEMKKRAKIILNRQLNEIPLERYSPEQQREMTREKEPAKDADEGTGSGETTQSPEENQEDFVGPVDVHRVRVRTKLVNTLNKNNRYDLIMVTHQLLKDKGAFPYGVDDAVEEYLSVLEPGGHLVVIERGNPLGFEVIARARQVMIRPERYSPYEFGKIPRPWIRGSSIKPQKKDSSSGGSTTAAREISADEIKLRETLDRKFGTVDDADLEFEDELLRDFEAVDAADVSSAEQGQAERPVVAKVESDYYVKEVAPYPNHLACPLQMGNYNYYNYPQGSNLNWLQFSASVARPRFSLELKRGAILGAKWASPTALRAPKGAVAAGSGRPHGRGFENVNFSYLVMERVQNDPETLMAVETERARVNAVTQRIEAAEAARNYKLKYELVSEEVSRASDGEAGAGKPGKTGASPLLWSSEHWPRIIRAPLKRKGHVIFHVLTFDGSVEKWIVPKSLGREVYHDARKALKGDRWGHGCKTRSVLFSSTARHHRTQHDKYAETFAEYEQQERRAARKAKRELKKTERREAREQAVAEDGRDQDGLMKQLVPAVREFEAKMRGRRQQ